MHPFRPVTRWFAALPAPVRGAVWMTLSACSFAISTAFARYASVGAGMDPILTTFWRCFLGVMFMLPWLHHAGIRVMATRNMRWYMLRCFFGTCAAYGFFFGVTLLPVAEATALLFATPLFVSVGAVLVLKEQMHWRRWAATLAGFTGMLIIIRPGVGEYNVGALLVLGSALCVGSASLIVKKLSRTEPPDAIAFYQTFLMTPLVLIPALFVWVWPTLEQLGVLLILSLAATWAHRSLGRAYAAADASMMQPFDFTRLIFAVGLGFALFSELPDLWTVVGAVIIFASTLYVAHREARAHRAEKAATKPV